MPRPGPRPALGHRKLARRAYQPHRSVRVKQSGKSTCATAACRYLDFCSHADRFQVRNCGGRRWISASVVAHPVAIGLPRSQRAHRLRCLRPRLDPAVRPRPDPTARPHSGGGWALKRRPCAERIQNHGRLYSKSQRRRGTVRRARIMTSSRYDDRKAGSQQSRDDETAWLRVAKAQHAPDNSAAGCCA